MPVTVKKVVLWRKEIENKPGVLAGVLEPLAGADLQVVMGYRYPGAENKAAIELYPIANKKNTAAAQSAGLEASSIPTLLVQGDNRPGLGYAIAKALRDGGINIGFLVGQVILGKYSAVVGFDNDTDADRAIPLIKKAVSARK